MFPVIACRSISLRWSEEDFFSAHSINISSLQDEHPVIKILLKNKKLDLCITEVAQRFENQDTTA